MSETGHHSPGRLLVVAAAARGVAGGRAEASLRRPPRPYAARSGGFARTTDVSI